MYYFIVHFKHFELIFEMVELKERVVMIECIDTILKDDDNGELCIFLIFESLMSENCLNNEKYSQYFQFILDYFYELKTKEENQKFFNSIHKICASSTNLYFSIEHLDSIYESIYQIILLFPNAEEINLEENEIELLSPYFLNFLNKIEPIRSLKSLIFGGNHYSIYIHENPIELKNSIFTLLFKKFEKIDLSSLNMCCDEILDLMIIISEIEYIYFKTLYLNLSYNLVIRNGDEIFKYLNKIPLERLDMIGCNFKNVGLLYLEALNYFGESNEGLSCRSINLSSIEEEFNDDYEEMPDDSLDETKLSKIRKQIIDQNVYNNKFIIDIQLPPINNLLLDSELNMMFKQIVERNLEMYWEVSNTYAFSNDFLKVFMTFLLMNENSDHPKLPFLIYKNIFGFFKNKMFIC